MHEQLNDGLTLFGQFGSRKYLNAAERARFIKSTQRFPAKLRLICLTLGCSGARISEVLAITPHSLDFDSGTVCIRTLKRRKRNSIRQVPLPPALLADLDAKFVVRDAQRDPGTRERK